MPSRHRQFYVRCFLVVLFLSSFILCLCLNYVPSSAVQVRWGQVAIAQSSFNPSQLVQRGIEQYRAGDVLKAIASWQTALSAYQNNSDRQNAAIVSEKLAIAHQQIGQFEQAIDYWQAAIANYRLAKDDLKVERLLVEQAQTYSRLGQTKNAIALLCGAAETEDCLQSEGSALQIARKLRDFQGEVAALGSLGEAYRLRGNYDKAITTLEASLKVTQENNLPAYRASVLNSLGNAYFSKGQLGEQRANSAQFRNAETKADEFTAIATSDYKQALAYFQGSLKLTRTQNDQSSQMRTLLNLLQLYSRAKNAKLPDRPHPAEQTVTEALALLEKLPDSAEKVYAAINLAEIEQLFSASNLPDSQAQCLSRQLNDAQAEKLLKQAVAIAQNIQDSRSASFALGKLGHLYECRQDYDRALDFTNQARLAADQKLRAKDSLYLWEWQAGRIFEAQAQKVEASKAYGRAIAVLEGEGGIRDKLLIATQDLQFNFRDTISPLYRDFARLKLESAQTLPVGSQEYQKELDSALDTIDALKLAELQNYFGDDCVLTVFDKERVDDLETEDTAVFSSIILEQRIAIIVSLPNSEKKGPRRIKMLSWINYSQELKAEIETLSREIQTDGSKAFMKPAQNLYKSIIEPFAKQLDPKKIKTIVFIQDGLLRNIPMAALHDGREFLVQRYAIATTPGLRLTSPKPLAPEKLRILALGLTQAATVDGEKFAPLANVSAEIEQVVKRSPDSKKLLNAQFTRQSLEKELEQAVYPIIHIATHGRFGTIAEDSFLVAGNQEKITITQLESDIRRFSSSSEPVDLLALTACQTGIGDDRTTLGIAGITVQAGVRSALASLWYIDDAFTQELVAKFYDNLRSRMSKAEALQAAQKSLISQNDNIHPAYWAPFILIGNWL